MSTKPPTKFPHLAIGQPFIWHGKRYVKTSPLLGCAEDTGQSQMIPRSALVEIAAPSSAAAAKPAAHSPQTALETLHQAALAGVELLAAEATPQTVLRVRRDLQAAYQRARESLEATE